MPDRLVVSNTSPLLYLHQIGQLDLLRQLYGKVVVPGAVARELARGAQLGIDVPDLGRHPWVEVAERRNGVCNERWSISDRARRR